MLKFLAVIAVHLLYDCALIQCLLPAYTESYASTGQYSQKTTRF